MEKLFGIPMNQLTIILLTIFGVGTVIAGLVALRNRVAFKVGARNIPRRRSQTALIVLGLMLATVLFSAAFSAGDTLTHSIRVLVLGDLGEVDVVVRGESHEADGRHAFFDQSVFQTVQQVLADDPDVEGVAPMVREWAPVVAPQARQSEPWVAVLGVAEEWMQGFDRLVDDQGNTLSVNELTPDEAFISHELAKELDVEQGGTVLLFLGTQPTSLQVAAIYHDGGHPAGQLSVAMSMHRLQALADHQGQITDVVITHRGDAIAGAKHTDAVLLALEPVLEGTDLKAEPQKKDALESAESEGNFIATIFFTFAQFSIAAGILLIFLLFVMLAAERKRELGIARAVGTQRGHVIQMFSFEGAIYALIAAAVGSTLGVVVGYGMVRIMSIAFSEWNLDLVFEFRWRSVVIAYTLGMALTFVVVLVSSWRVSRLNIVRAIRDLPEPSMRRRSLKSLIFAFLVTLLGVLLTVSGYQGEQASPFNLGVSLLIMGVPLLARWLGLPDRLAFTVAGLGLVVWWLVPASAMGLPEMEQGIEIFFISGIMLVIGAVWTVMYNSDLLLAILVRLFGPVRGLAPVLKTAVTYPMQNRLRTGITLAMFSLIVFTLVMMGFIIAANDAVWEDVERLSGGYHVRAYANPINPIPDIRTALQGQGTDAINPEDLEAIASMASAQTTVKQEGTSQEFVDWWIEGHDAGYAESVSYDFALMADGYASSREVWRALQEQPGTAVVNHYMVPTKNKFTLSSDSPDIQLEGFFIEDETLPEVHILVHDPRTGDEERLRVIGVLDGTTGYGAGIMVSLETLNDLVSEEVFPNNYMFRLREGVDAKTTARALESSFLEHGLQTVVIADEVREYAGANRVMNTLLEGFMGLGLVVGIAALGVVAARSVVERRQQIGILRALGFQKEMVQLSFLIESSFVALLGIAIGVVLGTLLAYNMISEMSKEIQGLTFQPPWLNILIVVGIAYGASLLTTFLPARQASKVYPAEALRFE